MSKEVEVKDLLLVLAGAQVVLHPGGQFQADIHKLTLGSFGNLSQDLDPSASAKPHQKHEPMVEWLCLAYLLKHDSRNGIVHGAESALWVACPVAGLACISGKWRVRVIGRSVFVCISESLHFLN